MKRYNLILFDFDGNLADLNGFIYKYTKDFVEEHRLIVNQQLRDFYREINKGTSTLDPLLIDQFKQGMRQSMPDGIQLIEGVLQTLKSLKERGYRLGIVSTGYLERLGKILEAKGMTGYFDVLIGRDSVENQKPHPEPILKALERTAEKAARVLYVGHDQGDIETGKAAGVDTVFFAVDHTYAEYIKDWIKENKPTYLINRFEELLRILP